MPNVVLLGTLDTKWEEYNFLRDRIQEFDLETTLVDVGVFEGQSDQADISNTEVAQEAGIDLAQVAAAGDRGAAVEAMSDAAAALVTRLHSEGKLDGIIGLGGTGGTTLITKAMRKLPVGVPKVMVSTVASGDTRPYVGALDITMMYSVVDIAGLNTVSRKILGNAAGAVAGMVQVRIPEVDETEERPLVAATMFGVTTPCVQRARQRLEENGYEVLVFHATGTGGQSMEELARGGLITGVLDITTTELADELVGGVFSAGPDRLTVAGAEGLPQVVSLGALDMVNFGAMDTVPEQFRHRNLYKHNASTTLMRTTPDECAELGRRVADRLNSAKGPVSVFVPLRGVSMIATEGGPFHDPAADEQLIENLKANLASHIELRLVDADVNDEDFAVSMADTLTELIQKNGNRKGEKA